MREIFVTDLTDMTPDRREKLITPGGFDTAVGKIKNGVLEAVSSNKEEIHFMYMPDASKKGKATKEQEKTESNEIPKRIQKLSMSVRRFNLADDEFMIFLGKKMESGKFYFAKALYQGKLVDWGVDVDYIVETPIYQIIFDKDGTKGYNIY